MTDKLSNKKKESIGSVKIDKEVIYQIITQAISELEGVDLIRNKSFGSFLAVLGRETHPGIVIKQEENEELSIFVKVSVLYGLKIPEVAHEVQNKIKTEFTKTTDFKVKKIDVNIHRIERGKK